MGTAPVLIAFIAVIIGGLGSLKGAVYGGYLLGILTVVLQVVLPLSLRPYRDAFVYGIVLAGPHPAPAGPGGPALEPGTGLR